MAAASLYDIRLAIKAVVEQLPGMGQVYEYEPDVVRGRSAIIGTPEVFSFVDGSFGRGLLTVTVPVTLIAGETIDRESSRTLDDWVLSASGVWPLFVTNRTLGGLVDEALAVECRAFGDRPIGTEGVPYQAAEVAVRVIVRRDA